MTAEHCREKAREFFDRQGMEYIQSGGLRNRGVTDTQEHRAALAALIERERIEAQIEALNDVKGHPSWMAYEKLEELEAILAALQSQRDGRAG